MKNATRSARKERAQALVNELNALIKKYPGEELLLDTKRGYVVVDSPLWKELFHCVTSLLAVVAIFLVYYWLLRSTNSQLLHGCLLFLFIAIDMVLMNRLFDVLYRAIAHIQERQRTGCFEIGYMKSNLETLELALERAQLVIEVYEKRIKKTRQIVDVVNLLRPIICDELGGRMRVERKSLGPFQAKFKVDGQVTCFDLEAEDVLPKLLRFTAQAQSSRMSVHNLETTLGGGNLLVSG